MKIFIIVDMQNDFITGPLGSDTDIKTRDEVKTLLTALRNNNKDIINRYLNENFDIEKDNYYVIFTQDTHHGDYLNTQEGRNLPIVHCMYSTKGWQIDDKLLDAVHPNFWQTNTKTSFSSLTLADDIVAIDRVDGPIDEIIFMGIKTDICVISNALRLKGDFPEIPMTVLARCCCGTTLEAHEAALTTMESCQIRVVR